MMRFNNIRRLEREGVKVEKKCFIMFLKAL